MGRNSIGSQLARSKSLGDARGQLEARPPFNHAAETRRALPLRTAAQSDPCEPVWSGHLNCPLSRTKLTPLGESKGAVELAIATSVEMALLVEMVVDTGVDGDEFLQTSHAPEAQHRPFPSSERQV